MRTGILTLLFIVGLLTNCDDNHDIKEPGNCDLNVIVDSDLYKNAPSDNLTINSMEITDDCLTINFSSSGCSGESWEIKLIDSESILESDPPQRNIRLSLKNEELCDAYITKELTFNIANLKVDGNRVILNLLNSDSSILYEY